MSRLESFSHILNNFNISLFQLKYLARTRPTDILPYNCEKFLILTMVATTTLSAGIYTNENMSNLERSKNIVKNVFTYGVISTFTLAAGHIYFKCITPLLHHRIAIALKK